MKKILITILFLFSAALSTVAQDSVFSFNAKQIISFYPINTILPGEVLLGYERVMKPGKSLAVDFSWLYHDAFVFTRGFIPGNYFCLFNECSDDVIFSPANGVSLQIGYRKYRNNKNMSGPVGFYINPKIIYKYSVNTETIVYLVPDDITYKLDVWKNVAGVKFLFGIQSVLSDRFLVNYYAGFGYRVIFHKENVFYEKYPVYDENGETTFKEVYGDHYYNNVMHSPTFHLGVSIGFAFRK